MNTGYSQPLPKPGTPVIHVPSGRRHRVLVAGPDDEHGGVAVVTITDGIPQNNGYDQSWYGPVEFFWQEFQRA